MPCGLFTFQAISTSMWFNIRAFDMVANMCSSCSIPSFTLHNMNAVDENCAHPKAMYYVLKYTETL